MKSIIFIFVISLFFQFENLLAQNTSNLSVESVAAGEIPDTSKSKPDNSYDYMAEFDRTPIPVINQPSQKDDGPFIVSNVSVDKRGFFTSIPLDRNGNSSVKFDRSYWSSRDGYSFVIPAGWVEIPKSVLEQASTAINKQTGKDTHYLTGFQLENSARWFQQPYILVSQVMKGEETPSYSELDSLPGLLQTGLSQKLKEYSGPLTILTNTTSDESVLDKNRKAIFFNMTTDIAALGKVEALSALFLGKESVTGIYFYSKFDDYPKYFPAFESVINSFEYQGLFQYDPSAAPTKWSHLTDKILENTIKGFAVGFLISLFFIAKIIFRYLKEKNILNNKSIAKDLVLRLWKWLNLTRIFLVIPALILFCSLLDNLLNRYDYSDNLLWWLRWICCPVFGYWTFYCYEKGRKGWALIFGVATIVYNPLFILGSHHLSLNDRTILNVFTIGAIIVFSYQFKIFKNEAT